MDMARIEPILTYEHIRQTPDDGKRYEILEGELVVTASPTTTHQRIVGSLFDLSRRAQQRGYGEVYVSPVDVVLHETEAVVVPDLVFIAKARLAIVRTKRSGAPLTSLWKFSLRRRASGILALNCGSTRNTACAGTGSSTRTAARSADSPGATAPMRMRARCTREPSFPVRSFRVSKSPSPTYLRRQTLRSKESCRDRRPPADRHRRRHPHGV